MATVAQIYANHAKNSKQIKEYQKLQDEQRRAEEQQHVLAEQQVQQQVQEEEKNEGDFLGGVGYVAEKIGLGVLSSLEGIWDYTAGGIAKAFGADEWAEKQLEKDLVNYNHADEWFNPSEGWSFAGDVAGGIGTSLPAIAAAAAVTYFTGGAGAGVGAKILATAVPSLVAGVGAAGNATKEAYRETGELGGNEFGYGALSGVTEAGLEFISGGLGAGASGIAKNIVGKTGKNIGTKIARETLTKTISKQFISEAFEEGASAAIDPLYKRMTYDPDAKFSAQEVLYSSIVGGLSGAIMGGSSYTVNSTRNAISGQKILSQGASNNVLESSRKLIEELDSGNNDSDASKLVKSSYDELQSSLAKTNGEITTLKQRMLLGHLYQVNAEAVGSKAIETSIDKILSNSEAIAEKITGLNLTDDAGKPYTVTSESLLKGLDLQALETARNAQTTAEKNSAYKKYKKSVRDAIKNNQQLRTVAVLDAAGSLMMNAQSFERAVATGKNLASRADLANFRLTATVEEKSSVAQALGIEDIDTIPLEDFAVALQNYFVDGGIDKLQADIRIKESAESVAESQAITYVPQITQLQDGVTRVAVEDANIAIYKSGDTYRLYDYAKKNLSQTLTANEMSKNLADMSSVAKVIKDRRTTLETERAINSKRVQEATTLAKEKVIGYSKLNAPAQAIVRQVLMQAKLNGISDGDAVSYASVTARSGLTVEFKVLESGDGFYNPATKSIVVNPKSRRSISKLLIHELTHHISPNGIIKLKGIGKKLSIERRNSIDELYAKELGIDEAKRIASDEYNAHYAEDVLGNAHTLELLLEEKPTMKAKILNFFKKAIADYKSDSKLSLSAQRLYAQFNNLFEKFASANTNDTMLSNGMFSTSVETIRYATESPQGGDFMRYALSESMKILGSYTLDEVASIEKTSSYKVAHSYSDVQNFIANSIKGSTQQRLFLGKISDNVSSKIKKATGIDVKNKSLAISSDDIRHIFSGHGTPAEVLRGQVQITKENFESIIETLIEPDEITADNKNGIKNIVFKKEIDGKITAITIVSEKKKALTLKSAWISKEKQPTSLTPNAKSLSSTSETGQRIKAVSINSISENGKKVNKKRYAFAGENAETADIERFETAKELEANGVSSEDIRKQTGWFKGQDEKWRFEINDSQAILDSIIQPFNLTKEIRELKDEVQTYESYKYTILQQLDEIGKVRKNIEKLLAEYKKFGFNEYYTPLLDEIVITSNSMNKFVELCEKHIENVNKDINDTLKYHMVDFSLFNKDDLKKLNGTSVKLDYLFHHLELFEAYPELREVTVTFAYKEESETNKKSVYGDATDNNITLYQACFKDEKTFKETLLHEVQHLIQEIEGFAQGISIEDATEKLQRIQKNTQAKVVRRYKKLQSEIARLKPMFEETMRTEGKSSYSGDEFVAFLNQNGEYVKAYDDYINEEKKLKKLKGLSGNEIYYHTTGEVEARDVESRINMTDEERMNTRPNIDSGVVFAENGVKNYNNSRLGLDKKSKQGYNKVARYIAKNKLDIQVINFIERKLKSIYGDVTDAILNDIAIEKGDIVYIVDSGIDNGELSFGIRKKTRISNDQLRQEYVRRQNGQSIQKGFVSDGLSSRLGIEYDNNRSSNRRFQNRTELSTNNTEPTDIEGRVPTTNRSRGSGRLEISQSDNRAESIKNIRLALNDIDAYTEKQYNNYGWVRANDVLNSRQWADFNTKFSNVKNKRWNIQPLSNGEYIIPVNDLTRETFGINNVLVFAKGTSLNPIVSKVIKINLDNETLLDIARRRIYESEGVVDENFYNGLFEIYDATSFRFSTQREGSRYGGKAYRRDQNGTGNSRKSRKDVRHALSETPRNLTRGQQGRLRANSKEGKVYTKEDAHNIMTALVESRLILDDRFSARLKAKDFNELVTELWYGLNTQEEGYRSCAEEIANAVLENAIVEDIYANEVIEEPLRIVDTLKGYFHSIYLGSIKPEIDYRYGKKNSIYMLWGAKKGKGKSISPDVLKNILAEEGIFIEADTSADIFFEIMDMYEEARDAINKSKEAMLLNAFGSQAQLKEIKQGIIKDILNAYDTHGELSKVSKIVDKYQQKITDLKEENKFLKESNKIINRIVEKARKFTDIKNGRLVNATKYKSDVLKNSVESLSRISFRGDFNVSGTREILRKLSDWYNPQENPLIADVDKNMPSRYFDENISQMLKEISSGDGKNFTLEELRGIDNILSYFLNFDATYNRILRNEKYVDAEPIASKYIDTIKNNETLNVPFLKLGGNLARRYLTLFGDPMTVARRFDMYEPGFYTESVEEFRAGALSADITEMKTLEEYENFFKENKKFRKELKQNLNFSFGNQKITTTKARFISLLLTLKREHARAGLVINGVQIVDTKGKTTSFAGINPLAESDVDVENSAQNQINEMQKLLSESDKKFIAIVERGYERAGELKRTRDVARSGYSNATEGYYYPIRRADIAKSIDTSLQSEMDRVSNASFNKDTVKGAKQALYIESVDALFERHIKAVSMYYGLSQSIDNFNVLFNLNVGENANAPITIGTSSKNLYIVDKSGNQTARNYFAKLIADIQGIPSGSQEGMTVLSKIRSNYAKFQLGANPKVWLTQLSSLFASFSILDADSILKGMLVKAKDVDKYCDLAALRYHDNSAALAQGVLDNVGKIGDFLMEPIGFVDRQVVCRLFGACQVQVAKNNKGKTEFAVGTETNKVEAGKLLTKVIFETQQNSLATERSAAMRSGNEFYRTITMFTADSMKNIGRVIDSFGEISVLRAKLKNASTEADRTSLTKQLKRANKQACKSVTALVMASAFMVAVAQLFKHIYNKDRNEDENIWAEIGVDFAGNLIGGLPLIKDFYAYLAQGYELENYTYSTVNDLLNSASSMINLATDFIEGNIQQEDIAKNARNLSYSVGQMFGIPVRNVYNVIYGLTKRISSTASYKWDGAFKSQNYRNDLKKAMEKGDENLTNMLLSLVLEDSVDSTLSNEARDKIYSLYKNGYSVLPRAIGTSITYNNEKIELGDYEESFMSDYTQANKYLEKLVVSPQFKTLSEEEQTKTIKSLYDAFYSKAVSNFVGEDAETTIGKLSNYIDADKVVLAYTAMLNEESDKDDNGKTIAGSRKTKVIKALQKQKLSDGEILLILTYSGYSIQDKDFKNYSAKKSKQILLKYILSLNISREEKATLAEKCGFTVNGLTIKKDF